METAEKIRQALIARERGALTYELVLCTGAKRATVLRHLRRMSAAGDVVRRVGGLWIAKENA